MPAFVGFWFPPSLLRCLLCIGTDFIKMRSVICLYLRLTAETETQFLRNCSQFQSRLHEIDFSSFEIKLIFCLTLNSLCRRL